MRKRKDGGVRGGNNSDSISNNNNNIEKTNSNVDENRNTSKDNNETSGNNNINSKNNKNSNTNTTQQQQAIPSQKIPTNHNNTISSSLQMLITKDENSDLAIW